MALHYCTTNKIWINKIYAVFCSPFCDSIFSYINFHISIIYGNKYIFFPVRSLVQTEKNILSSYSPTSSLLASPTSTSEITDARLDVKPIQIYRTKIVHGIKDYTIFFH